MAISTRCNHTPSLPRLLRLSLTLPQLLGQPKRARYKETRLLKWTGQAMAGTCLRLFRHESDRQSLS